MQSNATPPPGQSAAGAPGEPGDARRARRGPPPNPLYHPLFLPILLVAFCLWFGYDGFLTKDPEMLEHQGFNRIMFGLTALLCLWVVPRGLREHREDQAAAAAKQASGNSR
ncbi:MAG: hypothetical protein IPK00_02860 [Deltaproteobacteria bacterium]|nr:hypothetical protein [Deltaproteobacteria bacterium]